MVRVLEGHEISAVINDKLARIAMGRGQRGQQGELLQRRRQVYSVTDDDILKKGERKRAVGNEENEETQRLKFTGSGEAWTEW